MSGPMYFDPTPEQIATAKSSTCGMATPKDPTGCIGARCGQFGRGATATKVCAYHKPEAASKEGAAS